MSPVWRCTLLFLALLLHHRGVRTESYAQPTLPELSHEECSAFQRHEKLWIGAAGITGLEGIRLPGASGLKGLGLNQIAAVKWLLEAQNKTTGVFNGSVVEFYYLGDDSNHANGDPRRALLAATKVCFDEESEDRLLGFFGGISSEESKAVQLVASTFGYAQVSPVSEGAELSDKSRYPTFSRVFTPSFKLAPAIVDVIQHFKWHRIGVVSGETPEDFSAVRSLQTAAKAANIEIISIVNAVSEHPTAMEDLVNIMSSELSDVRVWVMFFTRDSVQAMRFFSYAAGTPLMRPDNVFIEGGRLADFVHIMRGYLNSTAPPKEWKLKHDSVEGAYEAMSGVLSVTQSKGAGSREYADFLAQINAIGMETWMGPQLSVYFPAEVRDAFAGVREMDYLDLLHSTASMTYDALDVLTRAADAMIADGLGCRLVGPHRNHSLYLQYLRGLKFHGASGYLAFDENGDRVSDFAVFNLQFDPSTRGIDRLRSVRPERVLDWRVAPPAGEQALANTTAKKVQWRNGLFGTAPLDAPLPSLQPWSEVDDENYGGHRLVILITIVGSALLLLAAAMLVAVLFLNRRFLRKTQEIRNEILDGKLVEYDRRPVHSDSISTELNGTFMSNDVRIHVLTKAADVPAGAILIRCKAPLTNFPATEVVAVHSELDIKGCVERDCPDKSDGALRRSMSRFEGGISSTKHTVAESQVSRLPIRTGSRLQHHGKGAFLPPINLRALVPIDSIVLNADPFASSRNLFRSTALPCAVDSLDIESQQEAEMSTDFNSLIAAPLPYSRANNGNICISQRRMSGSRKRGVRRQTATNHVDVEAFESLAQSVKRLMKLRGSRQLQPVIGVTFICSGQDIAPAIVAEHLPGGNLHDVVHLGATPLHIDVRLQLLTDIATGLKILHAQEPPVVHPNISPYNILLDDDFRAVLTQYGYPTVLGAVNGGLLQYAAPEVLAGESPSPQSDVYSFAMIAIEVLERRQLYVGLEAGTVLSGVRDEWLRPVFGDDYPAGLEDLLVECTAKNPRRRPTAGEIVLRLKEVLQSLKLQVQPTVNDARRASAREVLHSIFPTQVADQLEQGKRVEPEQHPEVTIFFSDIVGFTDISTRLNPVEVMDMLNRLYLALDKLTAKHGLFKVETIGDAYMAVGNLHPKAEDHTARVARFAVEAIEEASRIPVHVHRPELGNVNMRVGFHVGPVVASVIGDLNPRYCLFGDTVNTASRMESTSVKGKIHFSHAAYRALKEQAPDMRCELRTDLGEIKGKGLMKTYFLETV